MSSVPSEGFDTHMSATQRAWLQVPKGSRPNSLQSAGLESNGLVFGLQCLKTPRKTQFSFTFHLDINTVHLQFRN